MSHSCLEVQRKSWSQPGGWQNQACRALR